MKGRQIMTDEEKGLLMAAGEVDSNGNRVELEE
jgi:hypothetical protein